MRVPLVSTRPALQIVAVMVSLETVNGIPANLHGHIIGTSLRVCQILVTLASFSKAQEDLNV